MKIISTFLMVFSFCFSVSAKDSCLTEKSKYEDTKYFSCSLADGSAGTQVVVDGYNSYIVYDKKKLKCTAPMAGVSKLVIMNCMNSLDIHSDFSGFRTVVLDRDEGILKTHYNGSPKMTGAVFEEKCKRQTTSEGKASADSKSDKIEVRN